MSEHWMCQAMLSALPISKPKMNRQHVILLPEETITFYFIDNGAVISLDDMCAKNMFFELDKELFLKRKLNRILDFGFNQIGLRDQDVVLDRTTRDVVVIPPDNRLGL